MDDQKHLSIHVLREPKIKLRDVDRQSIDYLELRDSIREHGILQPLLVRPIGDGFEIIEGLHRFTAAKEVGPEEVPCLIRQCGDDEALVLMLQANAISPETKLAAHLRSLKEIEEEMNRRGTGALVCTGERCETVLDGFYAGLRWACHLDQASVKEQENAT